MLQNSQWFQNLPSQYQREIQELHHQTEIAIDKVHRLNDSRNSNVKDYMINLALSSREQFVHIKAKLEELRLIHPFSRDDYISEWYDAVLVSIPSLRLIADRIERTEF